MLVVNLSEEFPSRLVLRLVIPENLDTRLSKLFWCLQTNYSSRKEDLCGA